jgi:hypothetical protein
MTQTTLQHLSQLNRRFIHNYVTNDVAAHDAILHPRFQYINARGARIDRQNYLKAWATGFDADLIPYWDLRDEHILQHENLALVSAANKYVEMENDRPVVGMAAYTDVYVLEAGQWLCLQAQITSIAEAHWPSDEKIICSYINGILQNPTSFGVS